MAKNNLKKSVKDVLEYLIIGSLVFVVVNVFLGQLLIVSGDSMTPTFLDHEYILAEKVSVKLEGIKRGDVVVFRHSNVLVIKRAVGLPGERIQISEGKILINGTPLEETYLEKQIVTKAQAVLKENDEYTIPNDSYVFLGDNRDVSMDSREWGSVDKNDVVGKPLLVFYPLKNFRFTL